MTNWNGPGSQKFYFTLLSDILVRPMNFLVLQYQSGTYGRLEKGQSKPKYLTAMLLMGIYKKPTTQTQPNHNQPRKEFNMFSKWGNYCISPCKI